MNELFHHLTFIKFGGSVITNKGGQEQPDLDVIRSLAHDIHSACAANPNRRYLIGHGSGSFGHVYAARYGIHTGLAHDADWMGFALTARAALRLNRLVLDALLDAHVPAITFQPSASLESSKRTICHWDTQSIAHALAHRLVPIVHGDVSFDSIQGSAIISTEMLFQHLARQTPLKPTRMVLVGEDAVYTSNPRIEPDAVPVPLVTAENIAEVLTMVSGSSGTDVTGGMFTKVSHMWELVTALPGLEIMLIGTTPGLLARVLTDNASVTEGTRIRATP